MHWSYVSFGVGSTCLFSPTDFNALCLYKWTWLWSKAKKSKWKKKNHQMHEIHEKHEIRQMFWIVKTYEFNKSRYMIWWSYVVTNNLFINIHTHHTNETPAIAQCVKHLQNGLICMHVLRILGSCQQLIHTNLQISHIFRHHKLYKEQSSTTINQYGYNFMGFRCCYQQ